MVTVVSKKVRILSPIIVNDDSESLKVRLGESQVIHMSANELNNNKITCNEPQGKLTGYIFRYILDEQRKID